MTSSPNTRLPAPEGLIYGHEAARSQRDDTNWKNRLAFRSKGVAHFVDDQQRVSGQPNSVQIRRRLWWAAGQIDQPIEMQANRRGGCPAGADRDPD